MNKIHVFRVDGKEKGVCAVWWDKRFSMSFGEIFDDVCVDFLKNELDKATKIMPTEEPSLTLGAV